MAPIVLCVGGVPKQSKMAIEAEIENNFVYYLNSKCCRVPLEWTVFDLETETGEQNASRVSGVLTGCAFISTRRARAPSYRILDRVHLTSCFDFYLLCKQDFTHS